MDADRFVEKLFATLGQWFATTQSLTTRTPATESHTVSVAPTQTRSSREEVCDVA